MKKYFHTRSLSSLPLSRTQALFAFALLFLVFGMLLSSGTHQGGFLSSEVKFTDPSRSGLSIVPASCPSSPHYAGECTPPTCSLSVNPTAVVRGSGSTLSWSSTGATTFYITGVGYVGASGSTSVAPNSNTTYDGTVTKDTLSNDGPGTPLTATCSTSLTVYQPCTFDGVTISHGQSATGYQASTVAYGESCVSETRTCTNGSLSGSYAYSSCSVGPAASCTLDGATVAHNSSQSFYTTQTTPAGTLCSAVATSRTCTNGTLSGSSEYQYASCACTPSEAWTCTAGDTVIVRTSTAADCSVTVTQPTTCSSPAFCSTGSSVCLYPAPSYTPSEGGALTGHLQIRPQVVPANTPSLLYWNIEYVSGCTVTGSNGDQWTGAYSGANGTSTSPINQRTTYELHCTGLDGSSITDTPAIVDVVPIYQER